MQGENHETIDLNLTGLFTLNSFNRYRWVPLNVTMAIVNFCEGKHVFTLAFARCEFTLIDLTFLMAFLPPAYAGR